MNKRGKELGLTNTNFKNPHGLTSDGHYTTANDLAFSSGPPSAFWQTQRLPLFVQQRSQNCHYKP